MNSRELILAAPAKTNLHLRITGKRDDGFHEIDTRMARLKLADTLTISVSRGEREIRLSCDDKSLPVNESNLAVKAARLFLERTNQSVSVDMALEKRIPVGAGLGGGSSDAASVLLGLNQLLETGHSVDYLVELASEIGSDVPFFIHQSTCHCTGRGEVVTPLQSVSAQELRQLPILLLKPQFPVSAAFAYQNWADSTPIPGVFYGEQLTPWGTVINDLELPVFKKYLLLPHLKSWLLDQKETHAAIMSGSGSTMLAITRSHGCCHRLAELARKAFGKSMWIHETETL